MCLIFISLKNNPSYKLIIAANRDEFYHRQTAPANYWKDYPDILGGRDLEAMGTWMAMTRHGKISMVTNYRDPQHINPHAPSRGKLVTDFLTQPVAPKKYLESIEPNASLYNGFNLIVGNPDSLYYYSNYQKGIAQLKGGFYGLSNHLLDTPWPKVVRGKKRMEKIMSQPEIDPESLFVALYDELTAPVDQLPDTGIGLERELALSSMFIKTTNYGTRCSTVVLVGRDDSVIYCERAYNTTDFSYETASFSFKV